MLAVFMVLILSPLVKASEEDKELRILSYNIQMLPRWIAHLGHGPVKRAKLIPEKLIQDNIDIIVFQEAFDKHCMKLISRQLKTVYPYSIGPANDKKCGIKLNSGVMIFSKTPLTFVDQVDFTECEKEDCFARKGALLVETEFNGKKIQVLGTHKEAGGSLPLKAGQYIEILGMVRKHTKPNVPQFLCGDFNIRKDSDLYFGMLGTFEMKDGPITGELQYTSDHLLNDMSSYRPDDRKIIDFIFYRGNGHEPISTKREIRRYMQRWHKDHEDLSDHLAVLMSIKL
jgi:endonuclease/exonuclease/phosphatase family metal-dependent hydrolase